MRTARNLTLIFIVSFLIFSNNACSNDDGETPIEETSDESDDTNDEDSSEDGESGQDNQGGSSDEDTGEGSEDNDGSNDGESDENGNGEGTGGDGSEEGDGNSEEEGSDTGDEGTGNDGDAGQGDGSMDDEGDGTEEDTDTTPPTVIFETPQDNQVFQEGSNVMVLANVTDDVAVANAQLFVNGNFVRQESVTPYEWGTTNPNDTALMNLAQGTYELRVVGTDGAGNATESTITIVVEASMDDDNDDGTDGTTDETDCDAANVVFNEANGMVAIEFEKGNFTEEWFLRTQESGFTGDGYMVWEGTQRFSNPAFGRSTFKIRIENPGTYQFIWRSAVTIGDNGTEHNDTWLRFADAADFFGQKQGSIVFPRDTGKTPNPNGSSRDGFFKIFRSGNDLSFKWQSKTSDNDGHDIFVVFDSPGVYTMDIAARSSGHAIDKFILFDTSIPMSDAIGASGNDSGESCNN